MMAPPAKPPRQWYRLWVEMFHDPKIRVLSPEHRWLWVSILGMARDSCRPGYLLLTETLPLEVGHVAVFANLVPEVVEEGISKFHYYGMLETVSGVWHVVQWNKRQYESDFARSKVPEDVIREVHERDGGHCRDCGTDHALEIDHVVPRSKGGTDELDNLQLLCGPCNRRKGARIRQQRHRAKEDDVSVTDVTLSERNICDEASRQSRHASVNRSQIPETELSPSLAVSQEGPDEGPLVKGDVATLRALLLPRLAGAGEGDVAPQLGGDQGRSVSLDRLARVTDRLVRLCTGNSLDFVRREASEVITWASTSLDLNIIDEVIGSAGGWKDRPTLPRAVAGPIRKRAKQLGVPMREFLPKQRLNAAS